MLRQIAVLSAALLAVAAPPAARAQGPAGTGSPAAEAADQPDATALLRAAEAAEAEGDVVSAIALYERIVAELPSDRAAARALRRLPALRELLGPDQLVRVELEAIKRDYARLGSDAALEAVGALLPRAREAETRAALLLWLANEQAWVRADPREARRLYLEAAHTEGASAEQLADAWAGVVASARAWGEVNEVRRELARFVAAHPELDEDIGGPTLRDELQDRLWRMATTAVGGAALLLLLVRFAAARGWRALRADTLRRWRPWRAGLFLAWAFGGAGLIAESWEHGFFLPFACCAPALWAVYLLAAGPGWCRSAPPSRALRVAEAVVAALASLGAVYFTLSLFGREAILGM